MPYRSTFVLLTPFLLLACGPKEVAPPATPDKVAPQVENVPGPPAQGQGRVTIDANGEPATVHVVVAEATSIATYRGHVGYARGVVASRVCQTTPCAANLPYGEHELVFQSHLDPEKRSRGTVMVGEKPSVFRHALGRLEGPSALTIGGAVLASLGLTSAVVGGTFLLVASASHSSSADGMQNIGTVTTVGGLVAVAVGVGMLILGRPVYQQGSSVQYPDGPTREQAEPTKGSAKATGGTSF